jgi:CheY-like chemotaxis protein
MNHPFQEGFGVMGTILIIDDEVSFLDILQVILQRAGYRTLVATNGRDGLELIQHELPALVITDDMLPGISGGELCQLVKNTPGICHIPVVLYSAGPRVRDRDFVLQIGADATLTKPFKPTDVLRLVQQFTSPALAVV